MADYFELYRYPGNKPVKRTPFRGFGRTEAVFALIRPPPQPLKTYAIELFSGRLLVEI